MFTTTARNTGNIKPTNRTLFPNLQGLSYSAITHGFSFDQYFRIKTTTNWATSEQVTGMFKTNNPLIYYGDRKHQGRNLLIFIFNDDRTQLTVDYYLEYCPYNRTNQITPELQAILSKYK
jgi:hypothetical protein